MKKLKNVICTGCGACYNICPKNAISMEPDLQGFLYPKISESQCVNCGLCEAVCPKVENINDNFEEPDCYAARASDDIRSKSSSGGMFTVFARDVLQQGGVVCGAAMEKNYDVHHICVEDENGLDKLRQSKYVQSNTEYVYREVLDYLKKGRLVLFTGCPCQVAAAKKYFKGYDNLILVDILCHGVPSNQMWKDYLQENFDLTTLTDIQFRSKLNGWRSDQLRAFYSDGTSNPIPWPESAYEEGFQRNIALRDGCENCEFCGHQRQGDVTIGDFWRVEQYNPELNDKKGTSVVLVNNEKGQAIIDKVKNQLIDFTKTPIDAARHNRFHYKFASHPQKGRFKTLYPARSFTEAVMQCRHNLFDIGLVGTYRVENYGGQLTQYALYQALTDMGYSVLMIEAPNNSHRKPNPNGAYLFAKNPYQSYALSPIYNNIAEMKFINRQCNTFVTGSDQMFNHNMYVENSKFMTLNFVYDSKKKIAYAASWGHDHIWGEESNRAEESYYLKKFDHFSVREDVAVDLCAREFGVKATHVLDPVFLCDPKRFWDMVVSNKDTVPDKPFVFAYILDPDMEKAKVLTAYAQNHNLQVRAVCDEGNHTTAENWDINTISAVKIESWLEHIAKSEILITDSFHGMCFAIIFQKQFLVIVNKLRGEPRYKSVLTQLGLTDRMAYSFSEAMKKLENLEPIDYQQVNQLLHKEKTHSLNWLRNAIESEKHVKKPFSAFDILDGRMDYLHKHFDQKINAVRAGTKQLQERDIQRIMDAQNQIFELQCQIAELQHQISEMHVITRRKRNIFAKTVGGIQCCKDHGLVYTLKLFVKKIRNRFK